MVNWIDKNLFLNKFIFIKLKKTDIRGKYINFLFNKKNSGFLSAKGSNKVFTAWMIFILFLEDFFPFSIVASKKIWGLDNFNRPSNIYWNFGWMLPEIHIRELEVSVLQAKIVLNPKSICDIPKHFPFSKYFC